MAALFALRLRPRQASEATHRHRARQAVQAGVWQAHSAESSAGSVAGKGEKVKALDLFCKAGGASMGLHRAGFEVTGVDIEPQPRYPFKFIQGDALTVPLDGYDLIWASPVCKHYSPATRTSGTVQLWPSDQIAAIRARLVASSVPYIIENVMGAPLHSPILLCGAMFGLPLYRHRLFESNILLFSPPHLPHTAPVTKMGRPPQPGEFLNPIGHFSGVQQAREAMGTEWMSGAEIAQAIPPVYAEYLARHLLAAIGVAA